MSLLGISAFSEKRRHVWEQLYRRLSFFPCFRVLTSNCDIRLRCLQTRMAQSLTALPSEQVLVECRALVFFYDIQLNRWTDVGEQNVFCRIQLLCSRPPGSTGLYRILARLESTGTITLNTALTDRVTYVVTSPSWHQIRIDIGMIYGLRVSNEAEGTNFSVIIQHTLRSLQGTQRQPPWPMPPDQQAAAPVNLSATAPVGMLRHPDPPPQDPSAAAPAAVLRNPDPSPQDGGRTQRRRDFDVQIDALCLALSDSIMSGKQEQAAELVKKMASRKLNLSIKLKNPALVTMDSGGNTITIRVVVEDKESSGGTFSMKVSPTSTVERLQQEVFDRYGFPVQVQKWIVGKKVPKPQDTLRDLHVKQSGTTVFLYLLSGKTVGLRQSDVERFGRGNTTQTSLTVSAPSDSSGMSSAAVATTASGMHMRHAASTPNLAQSEPHVLAAPNRAEQLPVSLVGPTLPASAANLQENSGPTTLPIHVGMDISAISNLLRSGGQGGGAGNPPNPSPQEFVNNLEPVEQQAEEDGNPVGWTCEVCTYINKPTRPGCEMCSSDRPAGYEVPAGMQLDERERSRIAAAEREEALFQQAEQSRQQEEQVTRQQNLAALLQTAQQSLIPNQEEFDCGICYVSVEPGEGVVLRECLHRFCRDCLSEHIRHATDPEVQCPHQDDNYACHATITGQEIQALLPEEDFNKFLNRSLATAESQAANSFHCKTPNCGGWCLYEDNVNTFHCPVCDQPNCLTCKAIHANMNCKEYQDDLKRRAENDVAARKTQKFLENMVAGGDAMHCPVCKIILLKKDGCDWMRCSMCRTEICWATRGPRWGPGGTGDITGGCKCRVGGKKCHPKCRNCH